MRMLQLQSVVLNTVPKTEMEIKGHLYVMHTMTISPIYRYNQIQNSEWKAEWVLLFTAAVLTRALICDSFLIVHCIGMI